MKKQLYYNYMISFSKIVTLWLFILLVPSVASAATILLDPQSGTYGRGDTFIETVRLDNDADCINAVSVTLTYPTATLRAVDFSRGDSILTLFAVEPSIDTEKGEVTFAGGIPGGYCGRIVGDAGQSNTLGKVVFTVLSSASPEATIRLASSSEAYINDGLGTKAQVILKNSTVSLMATPQLQENEWLNSVKEDTTPPQPFIIDVESTAGVFGGSYYIVFATTDKESGLDHFEIHEGGGWKRISSPYKLKNQSLLGVGDIEVRAVDKAGNTRLGEYIPSKTPRRQLTLSVFIPFILFGLILLIGVVAWVYEHRKSRPQSVL